MTLQLTFDDLHPTAPPRPDPPPPPEPDPPGTTARRCADCGRRLRSLFATCARCEGLPDWLL